MPGIRAWVLSTETCQDQNAGNPGLDRVCRDLSGPKYRESGPGCYLQRPVRTKMPGIRAWVKSAETCQDQNAGNQGLGAANSGLPGPESRGIGPG
jgi:hypothetical protein